MVQTQTVIYVVGTTTIDDGGNRSVEQTVDLDRRSLTNALAEAIAEHKETDPLDLDFSLYESIDTEALHSLFASASGSGLRTEFRAADVLVSVRKRENDGIFVSVADYDP